MRVGTSFSISICYTPLQDHPHACGDKSRPFLTWRPFAGSSPCVWGQAAVTKDNMPDIGIIPMRVGTRRLLLLRLCL